MSDDDCQVTAIHPIGIGPLRYRTQKVMAILMNFNELLDTLESGDLVDPEAPVVMDLMLSEIEKGLHITAADDCPDA
jgi:hypothetical protein